MSLSIPGLRGDKNWRRGQARPHTTDSTKLGLQPDSIRVTRRTDQSFEIRARLPGLDRIQNPLVQVEYQVARKNSLSAMRDQNGSYSLRVKMPKKF